MNNQSTTSFTTEELAEQLKVSKLTIYDLIKKGELRAYRVGRQMRVDAIDLEAYKESTKSGGVSASPIPHTKEQPMDSTNEVNEAFTEEPPPHFPTLATRQVIISGQDMSLDLLASAIEKENIGYRPLRSYQGSLNSLIAMYNGKADIVSTHLFDGDTGEYNIPYIKRILNGHSFIVINLLARKAGLYVQKGNPKNIRHWSDLQRPSLKMINREIGSGARVLLDEQLRMAGIKGNRIEGYKQIEMNHIAVASKVSNGLADVGIGIEKAATLVDVDFIPLIQEQYDLVMFKRPDNKHLRDSILKTLQGEAFKNEMRAMSGYDLSMTGTILYETP